MRFLKAAAGERVSYATPGLAMMAAGLALSGGLVVFLLFGAMMVLDPLIGIALAFLLVLLCGCAIAGGLLWAGSRRLRRAMKRPEDRA